MLFITVAILSVNVVFYSHSSDLVYIFIYLSFLLIYILMTAL